MQTLLLALSPIHISEFDTCRAVLKSSLVESESELIKSIEHIAPIKTYVRTLLLALSPIHISEFDTCRAVLNTHPRAEQEILNLIAGKE